jgi:hypothetical protein
VRQGESYLFDATGCVQRLKIRYAVTVLRKKGGEQFGQLEGLEAGLAKILAKIPEFILWELLEGPNLRLDAGFASGHIKKRPSL